MLVGFLLLHGPDLLLDNTHLPANHTPIRLLLRNIGPIWTHRCHDTSAWAVIRKVIIASLKQPLFQPLFSVLIGTTLSLAGVAVCTYVGMHNVAGPVIEAVLLDEGLIVVFIANRLSIAATEPEATNRVNTAFMSVMHLAQLAGTKAGNQAFERYGR